MRISKRHDLDQVQEMQHAKAEGRHSVEVSVVPKDERSERRPLQVLQHQKGGDNVDLDLLSLQPHERDRRQVVPQMPDKEASSH